jgi:hypothetical protein
VDTTDFLAEPSAKPLLRIDFADGSTLRPRDPVAGRYPTSGRT